MSTKTLRPCANKALKHPVEDEYSRRGLCQACYRYEKKRKSPRPRHLIEGLLIDKIRARLDKTPRQLAARSTVLAQRAARKLAHPMDEASQGATS